MNGANAQQGRSRVRQMWKAVVLGALLVGCAPAPSLAPSTPTTIVEAAPGSRATSTTPPTELAVAPIASLSPTHTASSTVAPSSTPSPTLSATLSPSASVTLAPTSTRTPLPAPTTTATIPIAATVPSTATTIAATAPAQEAEIAIVYMRSGGIANLMDEWTVYTDGRVASSDGTARQATPGEVAQLLGEIEALGFFEMNPRYLPRDACCDRFTYSITVRSNGREHTVTTLDAVPDAPPALWQIIEQIGTLVAGEG